MRKLSLIIFLFLFSGCVEMPLEETTGMENTATRTVIENDDEYDYEALAELFKQDALLQEDPIQVYAKYQTARIISPFTHSTVLTISSNNNNITGIRKIFIIVDSTIYEQVSDKIERYAFDINLTYGCEVIMEAVSGGDHINIKNLIISNQVNLNGIVFIGDIPAAWFENENDHNKYGPRTWPCDLYYMDLDGTWFDNDGNGIYDSHSGDINPEVFVGRISTKNMGSLLSEVEGLKRYLDKNHLFWSGAIIVNRRSGLTYTDKDWISFPFYKTSLRYLYGQSNYDSKAYGNSGFGKKEFLACLKDKKYEFIQLSCHTYSTQPYCLAMSDGDIYSSEIYSNGAEAIGYNLFCCSACNWTNVAPNSPYGFLAGAHIFNASEKSLVVVGSTKTGSMLEFADFYKPLGQGKTIGESLRLWWHAVGKKKDNYRISWFYGMTIIGDPLINFFHQARENEMSQIVLNGYDASNTSSHLYFKAKESITANKYVIPSEKHVVFNAPKVILNSGFECHRNGTVILK